MSKELRKQEIQVTLKREEWEYILYAAHTGVMRYIKCYHTEHHPKGRTYLNKKIGSSLPVIRLLHRLTNIPQKGQGKKKNIPSVFGDENTYEFEDAIKEYGFTGDTEHSEQS